MKMAATEENAGASRFITFSQISSSELNIVNIDHCYSKPWSSHPDASNARPLHMLFMEKFPCLSNQEKLRSTDIIDVVGHDDSTPPVCDAGKARAMLSDYEVAHSDYADSRDDWEDHIASVRTTWSVLQNRIFAKVMRVLQADRLARLSIQGTKNEPIQRRLQIDKAAKRVRFCFGSVGWDMTLVLWLHNLLLENLRGQLLTSYLEVLVTLKSKIPSLVEQLIQRTTPKQGFTMESLNTLLKRNWDPVLSSINQQKLKKLPDNPLLLLISNAPSSSLNPMALKRNKFWQHQLSGMGKVIHIAPVSNTSSMSIASYVENMITTTRSKILEVKGHFPGRPLILIGWHIGALVATHVALMEFVQGVVCLGFPTMGIYGNRGEIDDQIYTCKTPTLFVVGQHASSCSTDTIEDIREKLRVETGLVLVGGADDQLRMSRSKKRICSVTQTMVDRCIMEEMFEFLGNILSQIMVKPEVTQDAEIIRKQRKRKRKDIIPATDSQTGNLQQQLPVRSLKLGSVGTLSIGGQWPISGASKMVKRTSHKKHASKTDGSITTSKKPTLHLSFPILDTSKDQSGSLSKVSEAAAIASAPELSNLLQSIQNSGQQKLVSHITSPLVNKGIVSPSSSTTITTTTALTLSRFLASSGFFRTGALVKAKDMSSDDLESPTFKSCFGAFADGTALEQSRYSDETSTKQQSQILVRTGTSSAPFSIPLTFTMASKVLKSAPLLRVTGSNGDESHIQHLATSAPGSSLPLITTTSSSTSQLSTSVSTSAILLSSSISHPSFNSLSPITSSIVSSSGVSMSPALLGKSLPATGMETHSPGASIINIGTDTVFMKETSQSITSVPCTVSIDLGQIATAVSSNVMKLTAAPKISLIPTVKQVPVSGLTERLLLTGPTVGCQPSIATLPSLSHSQFSEFGKLTSVSSAMTNARPSILVSTDSPKTLNTNVLSTSVLTVSSSQLLSTLSSNTALIALKLSTPSANTITSEREMSRKDVADKQTNDIFLAQLKGNLNLQSQSSDHTKVLNTSTQPGENTNYQQNLQIVNSTGSINFSPSTASLIITSGNKLGTGQIVLHCQRAASSSPQSPVIKPHSPLLCVSTASETLGQVTSLLESSPVAVGDKQKPQTPEFGNPSSSSKDVELSSAYLSSSSSSSSSYVNQVQTTPKSNKTMASSYSTTSKQVLPTIASTRTRRIKTPKQYDL